MVQSHTCWGALPTKLTGSSKSSKFAWIGWKYGQAFILSTRSLSLPCCFTWSPACWDRTRIFSWHSYETKFNEHSYTHPWVVWDTIKLNKFWLERFFMTEISQKLFFHIDGHIIRNNNNNIAHYWWGEIQACTSTPNPGNVIIGEARYKHAQVHPILVMLLLVRRDTSMHKYTQSW